MNDDNIPADYHHDNKHLQRRKIGTLVANLKDVILNRSRSTSQGNSPLNTPLPPHGYPASLMWVQTSHVLPSGHHVVSPSNRVIAPHASPDHSSAKPRIQTGYPTQSSYAAVTRMPPPDATQFNHSQQQPTAIQPQFLNILFWNFWNCMNSRVTPKWRSILFLFCFVLFLIHYLNELF